MPNILDMENKGIRVILLSMLFNNKHIHLVPKLQISGATPLLPTYAFMTQTWTMIPFSSCTFTNCWNYWVLVPDDCMSMQHWWSDTARGKPKSTQRKTYLSDTLSTIHPTQTGLHSDRPATNRLNHDTAPVILDVWAGIGKDLGANGHGLTEELYHPSACPKDWGKPQVISVSIACVLTKIRIQHLPTQFHMFTDTHSIQLE